MTDSTRYKLQEFTNSCDLLRRRLVFGTTSLTPLNFDEEKEKFFSSPTYNPVFYYKSYDFSKVTNQLSQLTGLLSEMKIPRDLRIYLQDYLNNLSLLERTKQSIGSDDFAYYAKQLFQFGDFDSDTILNGLPTIPFTDSSKNKLFKAEEIAEIFRHVLHRDYNLTDYIVNVDHKRKYVIWTSPNTINIGCCIKRFEQNVRRLIVHEIESHALQFHNISLSSNPFIKLTMYNESNLYSEGLAVYNEINTGTITQKAYEDYTYRLKAVGMLDKSFRHIFNSLSHDIGPDRAYLITYRVKRGMKHTSKPGGFPKDASYLMGYKKITDYIGAGLQPEFLYISKAPYLTALLLRQNLLQSHDIKLPRFHRRPSIQSHSTSLITNN